MALESSGSGLRSSSSPVKLRSSLIVLSAGAALVALIGYLYMKSRQLPPPPTPPPSASSSPLSTLKKSKEKEVGSSEMPKKRGEEKKDTVATAAAAVVADEEKIADKKTKNEMEDEEEDEVDFERISQDLVRIVLNCAAKKLCDDNDDLTHLISNESTRVKSSLTSKRCISGGTDEAELDEATHELSMHSISLLETDSSSSSSSSAAEHQHTTSLIDSSTSNVSYHSQHHQEQTSPKQQTISSSNLRKSSSTTSTTSTASSAECNQKQQQQQQTPKSSQQQLQTVPTSKQYQHNKKTTSPHHKTNKPKPLNIQNKNTNDKQQQLKSSKPTTEQQVSDEQEHHHHHHHHEQHEQPMSLNSSLLAGDSAHEDIIVYEFNFPRKFCGKLIGKNGVHVDHIRSKTHTQIAVRDDPDKHEQQIVCVSGRLEDVDQALDIISSRFPLKQYPTISFKPISKPIVYRRLSNNESGDKQAAALPFENTCLKKVLVAPNMFVDIKSATNELVNVHVSAVVNASHVFVQFPGNSTYESLQKLDECMLEVYGRNNSSSSSSNNNNKEEPVPLMSEPIEFGSICVAPTSYGWHRAMVTNYMSLDEARAQYADYGEDCGLATVKFLDYGGYLTIPANQLRQLRSDFMLLPFQAVECYLDEIYVYQGTEEEGKKFLTEIIKGAQLKLSLCGYAEDGIPLIKLFLTNDVYQNVNLNSELANYSMLVNKNIYNNC